jgi:hypothetical protein
MQPTLDNNAQEVSGRIDQLFDLLREAGQPDQRLQQLLDPVAGHDHDGHSGSATVFAPRWRRWTENVATDAPSETSALSH